MSGLADARPVVVLTGGIGGAKLVQGLAEIMPPEQITAIVNTGDDFEHLGLHVSPDIDTLVYTLSGLADPERGWGRAGETWNFMAALRQLGGEDWFALGDGDLAFHVERSRRLAQGQGLARISADFAARLGIRLAVVPMSEQPVRTQVLTDEGELPFQRYFVARRCEPRVRAVRFEGAARARPSAAALAALAHPALRAILIAPSNPWLSVDPILAMPGLAAALRAAAAPVVAVTPLPGGRAVKGPTAKLMGELGLALNAQSIADHYRGLIDALLLDQADAAVDLPHERTDTIMGDLAAKARVAAAALGLADRLR